MGKENFTTNRLALEEILVRQFRVLQEMIELTKKERASLLNDPNQVLTVVEDKEALLDHLGVLEDKCRKIVQDLSLAVELRSEDTSIQSLLPFFQPDEAYRIKNLSEGISSLASQARELTRANQALALSKLDWLKATQAFLISIFQPEVGYRSPKGGSASQEPAGLGVEIRV
jgi:flagellar biosynthesis/type III secretory pathway chaperone